jgi:hypothetical protein
MTINNDDYMSYDKYSTGRAVFLRGVYHFHVGVKALNSAIAIPRRL